MEKWKNNVDLDLYDILGTLKEYNFILKCWNKRVFEVLLYTDHSISKHTNSIDGINHGNSTNCNSIEKSFDETQENKRRWFVKENDIEEGVFDPFGYHFERDLVLENYSGSKREKNVKDDAHTCSFCLSDLFNGARLFSLKRCCHIFHLDCLKKAIASRSIARKVCVVCSQELLPSDVEMLKTIQRTDDITTFRIETNILHSL